MLNVALGGTLHLDIRGHELPEMKLANLQPLRFDASAGHRFEMVNSSHHQALDRVADGLRVTATAPDGLVEAVELEGAPVLAVQWELQEEWRVGPRFLRVFEWFVGESQLRLGREAREPAAARISASNPV